MPFMNLASTSSVDALRYAIADLIEDYAADVDGPAVWVADAILALPELAVLRAAGSTTPDYPRTNDVTWTRSEG